MSILKQLWHRMLYDWASINGHLEGSHTSPDGWLHPDHLEMIHDRARYVDKLCKSCETNEKEARR